MRYQLHLGAQIRALTEQTKVSYIKFDFNHLSNVVPTDRHGHDAEFRGFCVSTYPANAAGVFINATNWTWHSPAWLNYADSVWLLAGDDGFNGNWPELAGRAQATTDRDVYFWRMWGDPADRPVVPDREHHDPRDHPQRGRADGLQDRPAAEIGPTTC